MPKEIYEPGELDRVRKNIGDISPEEAKRMRQVLGGDIGYEKSTKKKSDPHSKKRESSQFQDEISEFPISKIGQSKKHKTIKQISYFQRIKINNYMAQSEFKIITQTQLFTSLLDFSGTKHEKINPLFITYNCSDAFKHIESLVKAIRLLLPEKNKSLIEEFKSKNPIEYIIIKELLNWNTHEMDNELSKIQRNPRNISIAELKPFTLSLFKPIIKLLDLDLVQHLIISLNTLTKTASSSAYPDIKKVISTATTIAEFELKKILTQIKYQWYPLLMKYISKEWIPYSSFYNSERKKLLVFFNLHESELITPYTLEAVKIKEDKQKKEQEELKKEKEEKEKTETKQVYDIPKNVQKGLELLDSLFPDAGWLNINTFPDMYPYFAAIFNLPRGCECISNEDVTLYIVILVAILQELFYGFNEIIFIRDDKAENHEFSTIIHTIIDNWHVFFDEFLQKQYLQRLLEMCRMLEQNPESKYTNYGKKLECDILWIKKYYILPHLRFENISPAKPSKEKEVPILFSIVPNLINALTSVALDIENAIKTMKETNQQNINCTKIKNPLAQFSFFIANPLSKRLSILWSNPKSNLKPTNANLIYCTLSILFVLDYFMNDKQSPAYSENQFFPFRNDEGRPAYGIIASYNPDEIFLKINEQKNKKE